VSVYRFSRKIKKLVRLENVKRKGKSQIPTHAVQLPRRERVRETENLTYTMAKG
jgi:hypothetical protein